MKKGSELGRWTLRRLLGRGGNGEVWRADEPNGSVVAVKVLLTPKVRERLGRFRQEVTFLGSETTTPGILPMIDSDLSPSSGPPWYSMPVAQSLLEALGSDPSPEAVVGAFAEYTTTLAELHERAIAHRDLKPANLFRYGDHWVIGDFGLVSYPESEPLTRAGRRLGPVDYMAPEMRTDADAAAPGPADVYAMAKSLWVVLTGQSVPLPGPHRPDDEAFALVQRLDHAWALPLDSLMRRATFVDPTRRVTIATMHSELSALSTDVRGRATKPDLAELGRALQLFAEPEEQRVALAQDLERRLDQASGPPHGALEDAFQDLLRLLPNWTHRRDSGDGVLAYRLMEPAHWGHRGQRGRVDEFSTPHPNNSASRVVVGVSVAVRLKSDGETLVLAGGVTAQTGIATMPEWTTSLIREVPLGSSLERVVLRELQQVFAEGIESALHIAATFLRSAPDV